MMLRHNVSLDSVISPQLEAESIKELERILSVEGFQAKLVGANGEQRTLTVAELLSFLNKTNGANLVKFAGKVRSVEFGNNLV
ncbi:MAG: hypothetical protein RM338_01590 [Nostoc sp. DedQUE12a]|nr:hypothetical protein [Nostoc sp. DedQUE12a]